MNRFHRLYLFLLVCIVLDALHQVRASELAPVYDPSFTVLILTDTQNHLGPGTKITERADDQWETFSTLLSVTAMIAVLPWLVFMSSSGESIAAPMVFGLTTSPICLWRMWGTYQPLPNWGGVGSAGSNTPARSQTLSKVRVSGCSDMIAKILDLVTL